MLKKFSNAVIILGSTFLLGVIGYLIIIYAGHYVIDDKDLVMNSTTTIVDRHNRVISKLYVEDRDLVSIKDIPESVQDAIIATEDARFYHHSGIDMIGIARALTKDIIAHSKVEGGSTLTQQLAKNVFLTSDKSWLRKTKEAVIAINLERRYSKKKILEMYLNQVYFGHGAYGIQSAAHVYFNKDAKDLTTDEAAILAGLVKAPTTYSPITHPKKSLARRNLVLSLMAKHGYITSEEAVRDEGKTLGLHLKKYHSHPEYLTYIDMVLREAKQKYHLTPEEVYRGGYRIVVPMNRAAEKSSYEHMKESKYFHGSNPNQSPEAGFVLIDNKTGGVLAVQGGRNYVRKGINRALVDRQPGSTFKPLAVYAPALETHKYHPYSMLVDEKLSYPAFNNYTPHNYTNKYPGQMTMYDALRISENAPAVWLLNEVGINKSKSYLKKLGITIPDKGLSIALGGLKNGVSPLQMANAYRTFANEGTYSKPYFIQDIYDRHGNRVARLPIKKRVVFSKQTSWYITKMLESVIDDGTGHIGYVDTAVAGKTGSTAYTDHGLRDAWFVGYTPKAVGAVWIGYDRTTKNQYLTGSSGDSTLLFKDIINDIPSEQGLTFKKPKSVKDLDSPIRLNKIDSLEAVGTLGKFGMPAVQLTWEPLADKRVIYHIYEVKDGEKLRVGEVTGKGSYTINFSNPFAKVTYLVVPFNLQTMDEGDSSSVSSVDWMGKLKG